MKRGTLLAAVSALALAKGGYYYFSHGDQSLAPTMNQTGEATDRGIIVERKTVDYEAIIKTALTEQASFLTATLKRDVAHIQHLETSIRYTPFPSSRATVRVKYHVEYPIGYVLRPGQFAVSGGAGGLVITLHLPQLIARPSVRLLSYDVLESGILIDEKAALLELQQNIQPQAESRAREVLDRPDVIPASERALRGLLQPILARAADGGAPPPITFNYR